MTACSKTVVCETPPSPKIFAPFGCPQPVSKINVSVRTLLAGIDTLARWTTSQTHR